MKFCGGVLGSTRTNWLNFGGDLGILRWVNERKTTITVIAYPDRGAGNDPKLFFFLFFFLVGGSPSPPRLNIFTVGNMGVMICLGQGGLRSLSASSFVIILACVPDAQACASDPCQNGGVCVEKFNGYECQCPVAWTGINCERGTWMVMNVNAESNEQVSVVREVI